MKVCIESQKWIKPATPTPPHLHCHQLSSIDQLQLPFYIPLIFRYPNKTNDEFQTTPDHLLIGQLEESLSKILTLYYPFAGRYHNLQEESVSCEDQGLKFVVATVDCKLDDIGELYDEEEALVIGLEKGFLASDVAWAPVVSVQVNVFSCGGLVISLSFLHKVSDIYTFSAFMNAWATTSRLGTTLNDDQIVPPSFTISSFLPPKHFPPNNKPSKSSEPPPPPPPRFVKKRFIFTKEAILKLKSSGTTNYSRVQLITALITRCFVKSSGRPIVIFHMMNIRSRAAILIPTEKNLCGNLYTVLTIRGAENEVHQLADIIRNSIKDAASDIVAKDWGELSEKVDKYYMEFSEEVRKLLGNNKEEVNMMVFSSWCGFGLNEIDFGWGKPSLVTTLPSTFAITTLVDCTTVNEGGIEAWVCLKEDDMACFQNKPEILQYAL